MRHACVARLLSRRGGSATGDRHLAGSAQLGKGIVRALMLHAPRARRDLVRYNCVLYMHACSDRPAVLLTRAGFLCVCLYRVSKVWLSLRC